MELPTDPVEAAQVIVDGRMRAIDLGEVNGRPFFNVASLGMGVELAKALDGDTKKRWGRFGYALAALRLVRRLERFSAEIRIDDGRVIRVQEHPDRGRQRPLLRRRHDRRRGCGAG